MKTLLLIEDDKSLGETLSERLTKDGLEVIWARDLTEARMHFVKKKFDLVILDVGLPDGSGFDFAKEIRNKSGVPFIFVTAQSSAEDRLLGYELGAEEYVPKPFHLKELLLRVHHVLENHARDQVYKVAGAEIDFSAMVVRLSGREEAMSLKETQVLKLLIQKSPKVLSRDEILNFVWGEGEFPTNRTVDNVILRLRQLLGESLGLAIRSVRGVGYKWQVEGEISSVKEKNGAKNE